MKLYFVPGTCSMSPHIVLREAGFSFELDKIDPATRRTAGGEDYLRVNPKGYVPALQLDDGQVLTEVGVILQYLADQKPETGLAPRTGTLERYRLMEWLSFVATELHKTLGPLFNPKITPEMKENRLTLLGRRLDFLAQSLGSKPFLLGDRFCVADAYLFTVLNWTRRFQIDLGKWPKIQDYLARVSSRPAVQAAMKAEGLIA
jgi:glutathione S-transferase